MHPRMDWRSVKFDWNRARAFLVTAEEGSLSAAARALGMTQPTLGRQVDALEQELGVVLFERVGRGLTLTPSGHELLDHVRAMGEAANRASLAAAGQSKIEGTITITASEAHSALLLPPIIARLRRAEPGIKIEIVASSGVSDLRRREADIAIRHVKPEQPDLIARLIREATASFYAAESWVRVHGHPRTADEAAQLPFVGSDRSGQFLGYLRQHGLPLTEANFSCYVDHTEAHWALVRQGMGIGAMMDDIARVTPGVVRVLDEVPPVRFPIWLVTHRELRTSRPIRVVFEALARGLAGAG